MIRPPNRGNAVLKLTFCLRRLPSLSLEEFQDYWLNKHAPLVRTLQPVLGMVRYVQLHRLPGDLADGMRRVRGAPEPYDGVAELWWRAAKGPGAPPASIPWRARPTACCSRTRQSLSIFRTRRCGSIARR